MNRIVVALLVLAFAVAGLAVTVRAQQEPPALESPDAGEARPGDADMACDPERLLLKVRPGVDAATVAVRHGGTIIQTISGIEVHVVTVPAGTGQQALDALNADPEVEYAEPDGIVRIAGEGSDCQ